MGNTSYIAVVAPQYQLPIELVTAIVQVESGGNRFAHRYEPAYDYLWNCRTNSPYHVRPEDHTRDKAPADFLALTGSPDTEWTDQQASWGLMQVMGANARKYGFQGFLTGLTDPLEGLHYGCVYLAALHARYFKSHGWSGVIAAYNAGTPRLASPGIYVNEAYVAKVSAAGAKALLA